ncbi:MAG: secretin N-terminal domain-containing protein, partial [Bacteriovoracia bacterium]
MARFTRFNEETQGESMLFWVRVFASVTGLISAAAFLSLALEAQGAPPAGGFRPGQRTFTNPFVNPSSLPTVNAATSTPPPATPPPTPGYVPTSPSELGEMDEDMSSDMDDGTGNPITPSRGGNAPRQVQINSGRNTADPEDVPNPTKGQAGVSVGGEQPGGVISNSKLDPLAIDSTTGFGSNEIITDFNYPDAEVMDIAKTLGKLTGKNFILDKGVKGKVTIISNSPITVGDAWKAFLTALDINGFTLIPSGKYIRIARQRDARDKQLKTYTGDFAPSTDALITRIFSLKHISADEVARTFRSFMPANSRIIPYDQTNSVIVTDTGSNIDKLAKMLEYLDVEGFDAGIEVIPVKFASAVELSKLIDTLIPGTQTGRPTGAPARPRGFGASGSFAARRTKEGGMINTIIADERTNTLIVHANGKGADQVRGLVAKLDKKVPAPVGGGKIHVVYLQFAKAKDIAATLNNLGGDSGRARPAAPAGTGGVGVNPTTSVLFEGAIKVSSDDSTNSLVITASPADFVTVQRVISKLDIPRDEVYVEAVIMEMIMTKDFEVSTNVVVPNAGVGFTPNGGDLVNF